MDFLKNLKLVKMVLNRELEGDAEHPFQESSLQKPFFQRWIIRVQGKVVDLLEYISTNPNARCSAKEILYFESYDSKQGTDDGSEWLTHSVLLPGLLDFNCMKNFVNGPLDLFDNPNMRAGITALWNKVSHRFYLNTIIYAILVSVFSVFTSYSIARGASMSTTFSKDGFNVSSEFADIPPQRVQLVSFVCGCLSFVLYLYFLGLELIQFWRGYNYFSDFWNIVQLSGFGLGVISFVLFVCEVESIYLRVVASMSVLLLWVNSLFFLKPFKQWGFFVELLEAIIESIISFLAVCFLLLVGITCFFHVLMGPDKTIGPFDGFQTALLCALKMAMLNSFDDSILDSENKSVTTLAYIVWAWVVFVFLICIMNALIALMNSTYEKVTEKRVQLR